MAIDTRDKRASAVFVAVRACYPAPDGTIDQADRQHAARVYRGILAGAPPGIGLYSSDQGAHRVFTSANWTGGSFVFEVHMRAAVGTAYARLWDRTAGALVASSELSTTSTTKARVRSGALTLTDGHEYEAQFARSTGGKCGRWAAGLIRA